MSFLGCCSESMMMKLAVWEKDGDYKKLFPDFSKPDDVQLVKEKIEAILKKNLLKQSYAQLKLSRWIPVLNSLQPGKTNNNEVLIIREDDWMDFDFLDDVKEEHLGDKDFILLERVNDNTIESSPGYAIRKQSYDFNASKLHTSRDFFSRSFLRWGS